MNGTTQMIAPVGGDSKRIDNVELIPAGLQLCTLFSMCDVGTQDGNFGPKHQIRLVFEFPQHYRVFYEGDDPKPACIFCTESYSMNKDSNLRKKFVQPMTRVLTEEEAAVFDISQLLGKHYVATIAHSTDGKWANIISIIPLNTSNMALFQLTTPAIAQVNKTCFYSLTQGFVSVNFGELPNKVRDLIINSAEGKQHKLGGGQFTAKVETNGAQNVATGIQNVAAAAGTGQLIWLATDATYDQYKSGGWTDELMISHGKAKRAEVVVAPTPVAPVIVPAPPVTVVQPVQGIAQPVIVPVAQVVPVTPVAQVVAPSVPAPPVVPVTTIATPVKKLVFNDPNAHPLESWKKQGWTEERIVAEGHATFQ